MRNLAEDLAEIRKRLTEADDYLAIEAKRARLVELEVEVGRPDLWDDPEKGRAVSTEYNQTLEDLKLVDDLTARFEDAETLYAMAVEEKDESQGPELEAELAALAKELNRLELRSLFTGEWDERDAVCEIHAKDGGTDAQDWAQMMLRMYLRWAENRGFGTEIDEVSEGQEAGILSATFIIKGRYAYGMLSAERGVHRLVRISPFDAQARRQTSFASMQVYPFMEDLSDEVQIDEKDLRVDTYRSSGAGGQHVNVTDSAVRITHLPTGIVVSCQNERSQMQNKARAMQVLAAKLAELARQDRQDELESIAGTQAQVGWGSQIRSYVLAPYQLVKDLRTEHETGNVQAVIDGDLDELMESWLRWRRASEG
ncbi:MAG: peptide chain release factor 2 [Acidimicrobiales bacterium]